MTSCHHFFLPFYSPESSQVAKDRWLIERTTGTSRQARRPLQEAVNAEKAGWRNRNQKLRAACCARYGVPSDGTGCHDTLSEHGPNRAVSHGPKCRDRDGAQRSTGVYFTRCRDPGSWTTWLRNCG